MNRPTNHPIILTALVISAASISTGTGLALLPSFSTMAAHASSAPEVAPPLTAPALPSNPNFFVGLAEKAIPSVVNISTQTIRKTTPSDFGFPWNQFGNQFGNEFEPSMRKTGSLGSGFVIATSDNSSAIILTNQHVVADADEIKVTFTESPDEKPTPGKVIGRDSELDVALIQVKTDRKLTPLPLGDSDALRVGEYVAAVGNPFGQGHSLTHGIISAKGRTSPNVPLATYIQTDTPINPGNSGGPLINLQGQVVGINNAIDARAQGIGFAIPINAVKKILPELESKGSIARGYMGVVVSDLTPETAKQLGLKSTLQAPLVVQVAMGSPAFRAGIRPYDVITEFNGKQIQSASELTTEVTTLSEGKEIPIKFSRSNQSFESKVKLGERPTQEERS